MSIQSGSRRSFLGHLGLTAAAAAGLASVPAVAQGQTKQPSAQGGPEPGAEKTFRCCVGTCRNCAAPYVAYACTPLTNYCGAAYCTGCQTSRGTCYDRYTC